MNTATGVTGNLSEDEMIAMARAKHTNAGPPRGKHYEDAELIKRAIEKYNGETGGAKDYPDLAAVRPEDCRVETTGGKLYVRLFARNVQTVGLVAEYEVVDRKPDLVDVHRAAAERQRQEAAATRDRELTAQATAKYLKEASSSSPDQPSYCEVYEHNGQQYVSLCYNINGGLAIYRVDGAALTEVTGDTPTVKPGRRYLADADEARADAGSADEVQA